MKKFDILDPHLPLYQNYFLEASAGTGKTFAIENLVVRVLMENDRGIELSHILAVTFTKEAAHEMKTRIRSKLESLPLSRRRADALLQFDEIQVFTIHGFCHKMLREFAFEANAPFILNSPDNSTYLEEMRQTVEDFFRTGDPQYAFEVNALLKRGRYDLDRLINQIISKMEKPVAVPPIPSLSSLPLLDAATLERDFHLIAPRYKWLKAENYQRQFVLLAQFLKTKDFALLLEEKEWFFEKMKEENTRVRAKPIEAFPLKAPGFFPFLYETLIPYLKHHRDPETMLNKIAMECAKRWKMKVEREDHFTFDALLHTMKEALKNPRFLEKVRSKYKLAIVDEFQDTDPVQWEIFKTLFLGHHPLYLVGDPKQSIYGFRNADIYTYLKAKEALGEENWALLDTNFRSSPQLIEGLNALFTKRPDWIDLPNAPQSLIYHPVKAGRAESRLKEPPLHYFGVRGAQGKEKSWPTKQMEEEKLFPFIASEILRLHETHKISFSEMVILIKDRFQGQRLQSHLNKWKIPSLIKRSFNLVESRGFLALEALLKAIQHPENERRVRAVLYGPLQCSVETNFFKLKVLFDEKGFASFLASFLEEFSYAHTDPSLYLELRQTADILIEEEENSPEELLHLMEELKMQSPESDPRLKLQGEEGEDAIPLMTTFASKGLEFDVVFALGLASSHLEDEDEERKAEWMRQLYVGFTRAKEKLYIPLTENLEGETPENNPIARFFGDEPPSVEWIDKLEIKPYKKQKAITPLVPPPSIYLQFEEEKLLSFSSLAKSHEKTILTNSFQQQDLTVKTPHTLPIGAETGILIHSLFEKYFQHPKCSIESLVCERLTGTHLEGWEEIIVEMVEGILKVPLIDSFCLYDLEKGNYFQEMEFLFPEGNDLIKGFIDLVFCIDNIFYVVDWKTNWLGQSNQSYTFENMHRAMEEHDYFLQAKLYREAVCRYVKSFYVNPQFGGSYYLFIRGKGVYHVRDG